MRVVVATVLSERCLVKSQAVPHLLTAPDGIELMYYVNVETQTGATDALRELMTRSREAARHYGNVYVDEWRWSAPWLGLPQTSQDQSRLPRICAARNMARAFAQRQHVEWLLFLDSDVRPDPDCVAKLLAAHADTGALVVGGVVPGRGCHSAALYITRDDGHVWVNGIHYYYVDYATMGLVMIHRRVFDEIAFGESIDQRLSEDPLFARQTRERFGHAGRWLVRDDVRAEHFGELLPHEVAAY